MVVKNLYAKVSEKTTTTEFIATEFTDSSQIAATK